MAAISSTSSSNTLLKLSIKAALFILLLVALDFMIGTSISSAYFELDSGTSGATINRILNTRSDIFIMGASTAYHNYKPSIMSRILKKSVYNAGDDGQSIAHFYGLLRMLSSRHKPKMVIWDISNGDYLWPTTGKSVKDLLPYNKDQSLRSLLIDADKDNRIALYSKIFPYNGKIANILYSYLMASESVEDSLNGYEPLHGSVDFDNLPRSQNAYQDMIDLDLSFNGQKQVIVTQKYFRKFIEYAQQNNVHLVCVYSPRAPLTKEYETTLLLNPLLMKELVSLNVPLIQITADTDSRLNTLSSFRDLYHLNDDGANYFSEIVSHQLAEYINW